VQYTDFKEGEQRNVFVYFVASIAALAGLLFGYDTGVISGAILFIKDQFQLTPWMEGWVVSAVLIGAVIGAATSGIVSDRLGRKRIIIVTAFLFALGSIGSAFAPGIGWLISCRLIIGIAIGIASFAAPLYISEVAPSDVRGGLVSLNQLMITIGIVVSYVVDYSLSGDHAWRWMLGLGAVPAVILLLGMLVLPESPRWLIGHEMFKKARAVLERIRSKERIEVEIAAIKKTLSKESAGWRELLAPWVKPALFMGIGLAFIQQATGINTVIYYAPTIFQLAGFSSAKVSILATIGVGVVNVLMTVVAVWFMDKIGRRPLLFVGLIGMTISLGVLGLAFSLPDLSGMLKWIAVGSLVCYIASFAISLGPIFWLIIAEIYPLRVRGRAMSMATVANWFFNFVVALTFLKLIERMGKAETFWLYAGISLVGLFFCILFVPETKSRTLEEIEEHLHSGRKLRDLGK